MNARSTARSGRGTGSRHIWRLSLLAVGLFLACAGAEGGNIVDPPPPPPPPDTTPATIRIDHTASFQTITGWYATSEAGQTSCPTFPVYKDALFDRTINELGLNRFKLTVRSAAEHPHDHFADYLAGTITLSEYIDRWSTAVNDNADAHLINPAGFQWSDLDHKIDNIALPMRQRLMARGEQLYIMLTYTDGKTDPFDHKRDAQEYAEFLLALYQHMQSKYGFVPDVVEVVNEPDTGPVGWSAGQIGQAVAVAGQRLEAAGFTPRFSVPAAAGVRLAGLIYDGVLRTPGAARYITEISYHRYNDATVENVRAIGQRARQANIGATMSEHIGSGSEELYVDLTEGNNTAWMQFALALCGDGSNDGGGIYYRVDQSNPANPVISPRRRTPFLWQYFRYIRAGAQRLGTTSAMTDVRPVTFVNTNGKYVVVANTDGAATFSIGDLPAGTYGITYATSAETHGALPDVTLPAYGTKLTVTIPAQGVVTVFGK